MIFRNDSHKKVLDDIMRRVVWQGPLYRAVYYLISLAELPFEEWYDKANNRVRIELLGSQTLDKSASCAIALAHDIMHEGKGVQAFNLLDYPQEWLVYFVQALEACYDYSLINYVNVFVVDKQSGRRVDKYRFPEMYSAWLFSQFLRKRINSDGYEVRVLKKHEGTTFLLDQRTVANDHNDRGEKLNLYTTENAEKEMLNFELYVRYLCLCASLEQERDPFAMDLWDLYG